MLTHTDTLPELDVRSSTTSETSRVLVVRHGVDRGQRLSFRAIRQAHCQPMFDDIAKRWPKLGSRLSFWETGRSQPDLEDVAAVVFLLQDPLRESFPDCYRDAIELAARARSVGVRLVNPPESMSNTIKTTQSRLWREAGLPTPPCLSFHSIDDLYAAAAEIGTAMIIKSDNEHAQKRMLVAEDFDAVRRLPVERIPIPGALSPIVDTREGFAAIDPLSPYATHYHKKRAMVFGNRVRHNHVFFADQPIVGCVSSTFGHYRSLNPIRRALGNARCRQHVKCDIDFHNSKCDDAEVLAHAAKVLGVEFCAIDYSSKADGSIVLWEANPFFALHPWPVAVLGRQRKLRQRTRNIHEAAADFFRDLLSAPS